MAEEVRRGYASISMEDDEDEGLLFDNGDQEMPEFDARWCLVGRFLTDRSLDFMAMQHKMASLWRPGRGLSVKELDPNLYLFQFFHEFDVERVIEGSPWTFDRVPLVFTRLKEGDDPRMVLGNFVGSFVESDKNNFMGLWRDYFRVRVSVQVDRPLKRKKKLQLKNGLECYAFFKYEDLSTFCFICGILGHSEKFCDVNFTTPHHLIKKNYDLEMKAEPRRRRQHTIGAKWLRDGLSNSVGNSSSHGHGSFRGQSSDDREQSMEENQGLNGVITGKHIANLGVMGGVNPESVVVNMETNKDGNMDLYSCDSLGQQEVNEEDELVILENKRRKTFLKEANGPINVQNPNTTVLEGPKNSFGAGSDDRLQWRLTGLYGELNRNLHRETWTLMRSLVTQSVQPWCMIGDMNNLLNFSDQGGGRSYPGGYWKVSNRQFGAAIWLMSSSKATVTPGREAGEPNIGWKADWIGLWSLIIVCYEIVKSCWNESGHMDVFSKINSCASALTIWGKDVTGNFKARINKCKKELKLLKNKRDSLAKQFWLKDGDQNSKYFHRAASNRRSHNRIVKLKNDNGDWVEWDHGLENVIVDYFSNLFATDGSACTEVIDCIQSRVTSQMNEELTRNVSVEEVKRAVFDMHPDKSPGPDGMTPAFYQKCWGIVCNDVVSLVQQYFSTGVLPPGCCDANIVLIPKKKRPERMVDLRPIAICNVLYKVITKVMANRMKPFMDEIVADTQSAFISGRLISDNIMVSFEVLHYLKQKRKGKEGYMALKLDMSKAYDRIEWGFLRAMLAKLGFGQSWVNLVLNCVTSACYKVTHGGRDNIGPIVPSRGIRQGDPLSPYIFILCAEGLSALIRKYEDRGWVHGCKVANSAPRISHMLFADDSYLYCKATIAEAVKIQELLHKFEMASGQKVNLNKSSIFYSVNTDIRQRYDINQLLHMIQADENSLYLGLPSTLGRNKSAVLGYLKDRVRKRLQGWEAKILSRAGKEILIKTVAQSLPNYAMSVFLLPVEIGKDIECQMANFWWKTSSRGNKGINWMSWDRMCKHKSVGGMGFRNLRDFNLALLGKQGWRLLSRPNSLVARVYKARYFPNESFLTAQLGNNPSFVWRSIWEAQDIVRKGTRWQVGDGGSISVLGDPWLPDADNPYVLSSHPGLEGVKVCSLMCPNDRCWNLEILQNMFGDRDISLITKIPLQVSPYPDQYFWHMENSGLYTVKSAYNLIQQSKGLVYEDHFSTFWKQLWALRIPPKLKNLIWRSGMVATLCWAIWNARNELVWKRKRVGASDIVVSARNYLDQWRNAQKSQTEISWPGFQETLDPALVEAMGVRGALSWLKRRPRQQTFVETDCLTVVQALRSQVKMISLFGIVISECKCLLRELKNVSICFIKRSANMVAHCLARASILYPDRSFSLGDVPTDMLPYLVAEFAG
uniref:Reverse transcriptase domain-containing protein n=1 Tax=Cannabis sativa TaxID=3483 RepID=A0A803PEE1_CANSA